MKERKYFDTLHVLSIAFAWQYTIVTFSDIITCVEAPMQEMGEAKIASLFLQFSHISSGHFSTVKEALVSTRMYGNKHTVLFELDWFY